MATAATKMSLNELEAYGRTAEAMSGRLRADLSMRPGSVTRNGKIVDLPIPYFDHNFSSNLEWCSEVLSRLHIIAPITSVPCECIFTFQVSQIDVYQHAMAAAPNGPSLQELLAAFLYHSIDYGGGFRIYRTELFPVSADLDVLFRSLSKAGFAQGKGAEYCWTDLVAPIMEAAHLWPLDEATGTGAPGARK